MLHISVQKTADVVLASDGLPYVRRGAQNLPLRTDAERERLRLDKGVQTFERNTVDVEIDVVSESAVLEQFVRDVIPASKPMKYLRSQALIKNGKPLVAAVLLFADEPQAHLPKRSAVKLFRYGTTDDIGTRETLKGNPLTIEGWVYDLIYKAVISTVQMAKALRNSALKDSRT